MDIDTCIMQLLYKIKVCSKWQPDTNVEAYIFVEFLVFIFKLRSTVNSMTLVYWKIIYTRDHFKVLIQTQLYLMYFGCLRHQ